MSHEENFARALCRVAATAPQGAPPELAARLLNAFRDHRRRRRQARLLQFSAAAAFLIAAAVWTWLLNPASPAPVAVENPLPRIQPEISAPPLPPSLPPQKAVVPAPPRKTSPKAIVALRSDPQPTAPPDTSHAAAAMSDFMALPSFDPAMPMERSQIIRVEFPGQALNLFGIPVGTEVYDRRIVADVAVAQDGRPYAVRFVQGYK